MAKEKDAKGGGVSKVKLALGAASLFFFIVGVKRTFRTEEGREIREMDEETESPGGTPPLSGHPRSSSRHPHTARGRGH